MFICESSLQFSAAHIVVEDYPWITRLEKTLFDVYLCAAYRCSNVELGPILGVTKKSVTPQFGSPSCCHLMMFVSKSGNLAEIYNVNRRL